jgi:hypothetical protein
MASRYSITRDPFLMQTVSTGGTRRPGKGKNMDRLSTQQSAVIGHAWESCEKQRDHGENLPPAALLQQGDNNAIQGTPALGTLGLGQSAKES